MFLGILLLLSASAFGSTLVWSDEFDGPNIDMSKWIYDIGTGGWGWGNGELEYYTARPDNAYIEDGKLVIQAKRENYSGSSFTSARLKTKGRMAFQYGTIEARIKIPNLANGLWPAFWLLGNNVGSQPWPKCGEVDILEMGMAEGIAAGTQNKKHSAGAFWDYMGTTANYYLQVDAAVNLNNDYHLFKLSWTPTMMTAYLDGTEFWAMDISTIIENSLEEFHRPFYVIMNMAVGGENFVHIIDPGAITAPLPAKLYVDWVRLYDDGYTLLYTSENTAEQGNFGVFTETTPVENHVTYGTDANLFTWNDVIVTPETMPYEGTEAWSCSIGGGTWWGMGVLSLVDRNMKNYSDGYLHLHIKTTTTQTFKIGIKSSAAGEFWLPLVNGGEEFGLVRDGNWHEVMIPLNRYANTDFQTINQIFMIAGDAAAAFNISLDNIYWSESVERPTPANGNFGVFTENAAHKNAGEFVLGTDGHFFIWEKTLVDGTQSPYEGSESISLKSATGLTWFGCAFTPNIKYNLTAFRYPESRLHFALKTSSSTTFRVGMKSGNVDGIGQKWITFQNGSDPYGFVRNGAWHVVEIPMSDFTTEVDLFEVSQFFEILGTSGSISNIEFDDICFTGGGSPLASGGGNIPPSVSITSPANRTLFSPGSNIIINATASDSDGNVTQVEFFSGTNSLGVDTNSPYSTTWHSVPAGTYILTARATDNNDANRVSSPVTVFVGTPVLTSITVTPSSATVTKGHARQFTAVGRDQFGQPMAITPPTWSVTGGGAIDSHGEFIATTIGGPFTVKAQVGSIQGTAAVTVQMNPGICTGGPANGDYTYQASGASNPTITFIPGSTGVGSPTCILYYSPNNFGVYPGYLATPNVPYQITASAGQTIYFYYTYSFPGQGEHTTMNDKHSFVVGSCVSPTPADLNGDGTVNMADFAILANNWLRNDCGSANDNCDGADYQPDGRVDFEDLYYLSLFWLD
jgi:beta-glucanase (GH16 family)